jgi:hypothetical protein
MHKKMQRKVLPDGLGLNQLSNNRLETLSSNPGSGYPIVLPGWVWWFFLFSMLSCHNQSRSMIAADSSRRGSVLKIMRLWHFPVFPCWLSTKRDNLKITALFKSRARPPMTHSQLFLRTDRCPTNSPAPHQLPNNERSLVPGASCSSHFNNCRCRYVKI